MSECKQIMHPVRSAYVNTLCALHINEIFFNWNILNAEKKKKWKHKLNYIRFRLKRHMLTTSHTQKPSDTVVGDNLARSTKPQKGVHKLSK